MTVYIDTPRLHPYAPGPKVVRPSEPRLWCHLIADERDVPQGQPYSELDWFALGIGLNLEWKQDEGEAGEHYDLTGRKIQLARSKGAVEISPIALVRKINEKRREAILETERMWRAQAEREKQMFKQKPFIAKVT